MLSTTTIHDVDRHLPTNKVEDSKTSPFLEDLMEKENLYVGENKTNDDNIRIILEPSSIRRLSRLNLEKQNVEDGGRKIPHDERNLGLLSSLGKDPANSDGLEIKHKPLDKKGPKQVKASTCFGLEKEPNSQSSTEVVGKKGVDLPSLGMESNKKVQESIDTLIRQTIGCKQYMSFSSRLGDKPLQRIMEHQHAMEKCVKSLKVEIDIRDGLKNNNANMEPHQIDIERDCSSTKGGGSLERESLANRNLQTIKSNVPQTVVALAAATAKIPEKRNLAVDHFTELPGWPLLSPSKVQLQKCEKCSQEFFSPLNHRRHIRTHHRRICHVDKGALQEDLIQKRKNVAIYWDKLNHDEMQQIFANLRNYNLEDLSGEAIVSSLIALKRQRNLMTLPPTYVKAGQDLLDIFDNKQRVFPLSSEQILSILDETSEKTFLYSQGDVSKIGLEEKNLVASLGYIVEQTLVKAWMVDKDVEALRNQQELFKEEEAIQMKRVRNVARKKKKKEKSRQKGLKEHKASASQLTLNEENELVDGENPSPEIVEEDNSPTTSSASVNSSGLENQLLEPSEMEVNTFVQNANTRDYNVGGEDGRLQKSKHILSVHVTSKEVAQDFFDEDQVQQSNCDLASNGKEGEQYYPKSPFNQDKVEDQGTGCGHLLELQDQSVGLEYHKRTSWRSYKELVKFDYNQGSYNQRSSNWVSDLRFQERIQQNFYRTFRKPSIGMPYNISNIDSSISGFYRGKSTNLRGTVLLFPATQQWAKKAQTTPISLDHILKDEILSRELDTNESIVKDSNVEQHVIRDEVHTREMDATDVVGNMSKAEKEPKLIKTFEKKELLPVATVPLSTKVVASNMPCASFNLNVNSEDWPPLSNLRAAYYPKSTRRYPLTSYQCEPVNKLNIDHRGGGYKIGLNSSKELEGSILSRLIPLARGPIDYNTTTGGSITVDHRQKGIMIGSVSVSLSDYVHLSRSGLGSAVGRKNIGTPLQTNQSYTSVLTAPRIRYTQVNQAIEWQKTYEGMSCSEFEEPSNMQGVIDSYRGPGGHYRNLSLRSTSFVNFNIKHVKGRATFERPNMYPPRDHRGERGILSKQPLWLGGSIRLIPQKVWRPIRSTTKNNTDPNASSGTTSIKGILINDNDLKDPVEVPLGSKRSVNYVASSQFEGWNTDISTIEQCSIPTSVTRAQNQDEKGILDSKSVTENALQNVSNFDKSMVSDIEQLWCQKESTRATSVMSKDDNKRICQPIKCIAIEQNMKCTFQNKNDNTETIEDMAHMETTLSHSAWIAEAIEFHLSRWHSALKDPETVVSKCEEEHSKLQSSVWVDFMDSLPSIATRLTLKKEDPCDGSDQIGVTKISRNYTPNEQISINAQNSRYEGSRVASIGEDIRDPSSVCENGSPSSIGSIAVGHASRLQNHRKNHINEGRIGSRCGSSCGDSSMSSNIVAERRDLTSIVSSTTHERPHEKRYMPKQGCPKEERSC